MAAPSAFSDSFIRTNGTSTHSRTCMQAACRPLSLCCGSTLTCCVEMADRTQARKTRATRCESLLACWPLGDKGEHGFVNQNGNGR